MKFKASGLEFDVVSVDGAYVTIRYKYGQYTSVVSVKDLEASSDYRAPQVDPPATAVKSEFDPDDYGWWGGI